MSRLCSRLLIPICWSNPDKHKVVEGLTPEQLAKMEKEMEALQRDLKIVEDSHGNQVLNLALVRHYLSKLFDQRTRGCKIGGPVCSHKICKVAKQANSTTDVALGVFLGVHPLHLTFDLWT